MISRENPASQSPKAAHNSYSVDFFALPRPSFFLANFVSARNYVMGQFPTRFETAGQLASIFALLESQGLDSAYIDEYGSDLAAATSESIAAAIADVYPSADELVFVILGDAEIIRDRVAQYGPVTELSISAPRYAATWLSRRHSARAW